MLNRFRCGAYGRAIIIITSIMPNDYTPLALVTRRFRVEIRSDYGHHNTRYINDVKHRTVSLQRAGFLFEATPTFTLLFYFPLLYC